MSLLSDINTVKCLLDEEELLLQLAEEAGELADAVIEYVQSMGTMAVLMDDDTYPKKVLEEIADVQLAVAVLLTSDEIEDVRNEVKKSWSPVKPIIRQLFVTKLCRMCLKMSKQSMKLRRAKTGKNPTPIPADKARADLLETIKTVLILCERMIEHLEGHQTVVEVSNYKADRWVDRLINGIKDGK